MTFTKKVFQSIGKSEKKCGPKICKYIKGKKYQYCRLGYKYKIQIVLDAFRGLHPDFIEYNEVETENLDKLGDLYIYENNRPMKFKN